MQSKYSDTFFNLAPREGWESFFLITGTVSTVAWSVREASWVETPGAFILIALATTVGLSFSRLRIPSLPLHLLSIFLGAILITWQTQYLVPGISFGARITELFARLEAWYNAAVTGKISTELLPFTIILLSLSWLLGYLSSWFLFRHGNPWLCLIAAGLALFTNLSFLPTGYENKFFLFMLPAMLLICRVSMAQKHDKWLTSGVKFSISSSWATLGTVTVLITLILVISTVMPVKVYVSQQAVEIWKLGRAPVEQLEEEFARLFSGITSRKEMYGRFFGKILPFQGRISFNGENAISTSSEVPTYLVSRTYSNYTAQGWLAAPTQKQLITTNSFPPPSENIMRSINSQSIQLDFNSSKAFHGGNVTWISRDAFVETLNPLQFDIELKNTSLNAAFPEDVKDFAVKIRQYSPLSTKYDLSRISMMLPEELLLHSPNPDDPGLDGSPLTKITLERKDPLIPDVVSWTFDGVVQADETYAVKSYVSEASNEDLRRTGSNYNNFIKDHYLQLPENFPPSVINLARNLTRDADNPLDKTLSIQEYLRSDIFEYSQDIDKPPPEADGTEYFLLNTKTGYSDYFASSMAVMLRALGIPTRIAAGYGPGSPDDSQTRRNIRDSDSHTWTQVYFQNHGWVDFEPTSNWPDPRSEGDGLYSNSGVGKSYADEECFELLDFTGGNMSVGQICESDGTQDDALSQELPSQPSPIEVIDINAVPDSPIDTNDSGSAITWIALAIIIFVTLSTIIRLFWIRSSKNVPTPAHYYEKMCRLGLIAGLPKLSHETPLEYGERLQSSVPALLKSAETIAISFSEYRYSTSSLQNETQNTLMQKSFATANLRESLRTVRNTLTMRSFKRISGLGEN